MASFQEQYDSLIQQLEEKGIPQPRLLVPAAGLLILAALLFFAVPALLTSEATVKFTLQTTAGAPVPNAQLTLLAGQKEFTASSDSAGSVTFKNVPLNQKLSLRIAATGYAPETKRIGYDDSTVTLSAATPALSEISFSAQILTDQRMPVESASVRFTVDDGTSSLDVSDSFGEAKARLSDSQRVVVEVNKEGYKTQRRSVILSDQKSVEIVLEKSAEPEASPTPPATAAVLFSVTDEKGAPVRGVSIELRDEQTQGLLRTGTTDSSGESRLDRINPNVAFIVTVNDPQNRYYPYTSPYGLVPGAEPVTIVLNAAPENDQLVLNVKDKAGNALEGATVTAYEKKTAAYITSVDSDSSGRAALTLGATDAFLTVFRDGFLPLTLTARNKETRSVTLESSEGKTVAVQVTVRKNLEPAPEAFVQLYSTDGFPLGLPGQYAAADGTVTFQAPKGPSSVLAKASLDASKGESDRAVLSSDVEWIINLLPPKVPFRVNVKDAVSLKAVNGATVRFVTTEEKLTCKTSEGSCSVDVPAETDFRVIIEHASYLPYQSSGQLVSSDQSTAQHDAKLYPKSLTQSATVQFQGFFTPNGQVLRETANAQRVQARFLVSVPAATGNDRARFAVRLAESLQPVARITAVDGTDVFFTGSDPTMACNPPASDNNSESGQWAVFEFAKGFSGTQQISVDFFTASDAKAPAALWIQYDLHGLRNDVPFVYPLDSEKLQQLTALSSVSESDFCGQKSVSQRLPVSRDVLTCQDAFCSKAVFVTSEGQRFSQGASIAAGQKFGMDLDVLGLQAGISQVQITAPTSVQLLSLQVIGSGSGNLTESNFESDAPNTVTVSLQASKEEKVRLHLEAKAVRAAPLAEISIQMDDSDGGQATLVRNLIITGTNRFTVRLSDLSSASDSPALSPLEAGLDQNLRVRVLDQFNKPVTDAAVELYECEGSPLNGQSLVLSGGSGGTYSLKVQPASIGLVGIRVSQPQFVTYEECVLPVHAVDFLEAEPESVLLKGDTRKDTVSESITLTTLLDVKSKVTSTVKCTDLNGTDASAPFTLSPKSLTLKDSSTVKIQSNPQSFKGRCDVTFVAKVNKDNVAAALVSVDVQLQGPPAADRLCPGTQSGVKCMIASEATQLRCTKNSFICEDESTACYQCNLGSQTLPGQISLSVSNSQGDATQTFAIALEDNPEECRVEGFTNNPSFGGYGYNNPYGQNPYGYQTGYSAPNSYYNYRPNTYTPYANNPFQTPGACMPYAGSYPYGSSYAPTYSSAYPTGYAGGVINPAYGGAYPGAYPGTPGINPSATLANPSTTYASCQAIIAKLSPYCQPYFAQYSSYNTNQNYYGNSYRDPWSNTLNPTYPSQNSFQYPQQRAAVKVTADCSRTEIRVSATYTGGETDYGGGLGGNQQGYLLVRTGGQTKQIPITVVVQTAFGPGQYPGGYPGGQFPGGYPSTQIPPQCLLEYQQAVQTAYTTLNATGQEGLDDSGLPDAIDVYYNKYTGQGTFEREFKAPAGGTLTVVKPTVSQVKMDVAGNKLRVSVQCKKAKEGTFECPDSVPFKATWTFYNLQTVQKERSIRISQDDFSPAVIQLLATKDTKDAALFDVSTSGDFEKAKCKDTANAKCRQKDGQISAEASSAIKDGKLEISNLGDYQIRSIPVRASVASKGLVLKAGESDETKFEPTLLAKPSCDVVDDEKNDVKAAIETPTCTTASIKVKAKESVSGIQSGWITFTFEDSDRNYDKVVPVGFKPQIHVVAQSTQTGVDIGLTVPTTTSIAKRPFTIGFKFPGNDEPSARKITLTLAPTQGGHNRLEEYTVVNSRLSAAADGSGTLEATFDEPGQLTILATGKSGTKTLTGNAKLRLYPADQRTTSTTPTTTQPPATDPATPPATPGSGKLTLSSLEVTRGASGGTPSNEIIVKSKLVGDAVLLKRFRLYIFKAGVTDKITFEQNAVASNIVKSGSDTYLQFRIVDKTAPAGSSPEVQKAYNQYTLVKELLERNGAAVFVMAALDKAENGANVLSRADARVKASDLGFTASTSGGPASGGPSGPIGAKPSQAHPPTESFIYKKDEARMVYDVIVVKNDWKDTPPAGPIRIGGNDFYVKLYYIMDGGWGGTALKSAGFAGIGTGAAFVLLPTLSTPVGWALIAGGTVTSFLVSARSSAAIRVSDINDRGWNCGGLAQWGNEAYLRPGNEVICSTWNPFGTSANIKIKMVQYYPTTTAYSTVSGYQSGWAEVEVSPP